MLLLVITVLAGCGKYNSLVEANATCDEKWANIETQLQRRYDLIPNLVSTVKAQASYEQETLQKVIEARASATQIRMTADDLSDEGKMAAFTRAQSQLQGSLSRLMMTQEKYPDLKANQAFHDLTIELEGTENRIARAREEYNAAVKTYNAKQLEVGGSIVNKATGHPFKQRAYFTASVEAQTTVPKVTF